MPPGAIARLVPSKKLTRRVGKLGGSLNGGRECDRQSNAMYGSASRASFALVLKHREISYLCPLIAELPFLIGSQKCKFSAHRCLISDERETAALELLNSFSARAACFVFVRNAEICRGSSPKCVPGRKNTLIQEALKIAFMNLIRINLFGDLFAMKI